MTDLEMTKLCAEAMGITLHPMWQGRADECMYNDGSGGGGWGMGKYDPLHDDAQAMALVRKFRLRVAVIAPTGWRVTTAFIEPAQATHNDDLNRAICECVANMQAAKEQKT